jgi:LPXTG-motif cell wall-anchored protein
MRRSLYLSALAVLAMLVLTPAALAQDQYVEEAVPEIQEELTEDPQEPAAENVAEGQREAMLEEQVEARQGADLSSQQEAALERQAEAGYQQPKELPKEKGVAKKEETKGLVPAPAPAPAPAKELPKTGGSGAASLFALGTGTLLVAGGLVARKLVR